MNASHVVPLLITLVTVSGCSKSSPLAPSPASEPSQKSAMGSPAPGLSSTNGASSAPAVARVVAGWASQTGFQGASTAVQRRIVSVVNGAAGQPSGPSSVSALGGNRPWLTDVEPDGPYIRVAINRYHAWSTSGRKTALPAVKVAMIGDFGPSAYDGARRSMLTDRIIQMYDAQARTGRVAPPADNQSTLDFLAIRRMCLEWVVTVALNSGGRAKGYSASAVTDPTKYRPGMGLYKADHSHAMIIVDIQWDQSGRPTMFRVAEANWGSGWQNPIGMLPWQRTVANNRSVPVGDRVIDFELP